MKIRLLAIAFLALVACDEKKEPEKTAASATASVTASAPAPTATPSMTASAAPSAAPSASAGGSTAGTTKDPIVSIMDPGKDPAKTVKAEVGGSVTLYVPKWAGTAWTVKDFAKPLGKAKEETVPGFVGPTPAAGFVWKLTDPSLKAGQSLKATLENRDAKDKAAPAQKTFTLTIELVAAS